ncbi:MAG TPA: acyl-CoA desaturase [Ilumatobacteraceae bacterium]|nr:acyl-CoA desaturase [Ilumatobacteraceae bacterium]
MNDAATSTPSASSITAVWRSVLPTPREETKARRRLHGKALGIVALVSASYWALVVADLALVVRIVAACGLVIGLIAVGTGIMHDANHGSFSRRRWLNRLVAYTSDALGASSWLWRFQHNSLHHGNPNVVGFDGDISQSPFARLAPSQPWRPWHRAQHLYMWPLYGFMAMKNLLLSDLTVVIKGGFDGQPLRNRLKPGVVLRITLGKLFHLGWAVVVPLLFNPWWVVVVFYVACSWLVGFILAIVFQLAHCVDAAEFPKIDTPRRGDDFVVHQMNTTVDISSPAPVLGPIFRWLVGGLDYQIEHHLAPRLPHTVYPLVAARFRRACQSSGIPYRLHTSVWAALKSHARWLYLMGRPVAAA